MLLSRELIPIAPIAPDGHLCHRDYGTSISPADCIYAGDTYLPQGQNSIPVYLDNRRLPNRLPYSVSHGTCAISVEHAGPDFLRPTIIQLVPDKIRGMARHVINECTVQYGGIGGYVTEGMASWVWLAAHSGIWETRSYNWAQLPTEQPPPSLITVSITSLERKLSKPGDTDPVTLAPLIMATMQQVHNQESMEQVLHYDLVEQNLRARQAQMKRGGSLTWWDRIAFQGPDEMQYECDADLGTPSLADCTKIQWQGLGPPSDTVTVGPGTEKVFTSNSCNLVISASILTVVTWAQLQTALNTLMNVCVENPLKTPQGGRAYHQFQPPRKKIPRDSSLTGLNALPSHVNMTILEHKAPGKLDCEWEAAQKRQPVSSCRTA